ncbi:uncharacterized protein TRUGW13939_04867 [Talaromyces rugulosus]|uniref:ABC transporter domain-containing protein n=1 Tax=Talaromyces rugulosus TaxID=121627 RepID=A0A7H8QUV6_TALRU|nr:uncharacterized protein TRUGW13939_04867 [Talaromyces rugulosus]QKX57747.1 hypothetical protein TRUGW13939_04867 [Talaromyces rugulosus]
MWYVQLYIIVQQNLNSLERVLKCTEIEQEVKQPFIRTVDIPEHCPSQGGVHFEGYKTRYAPELPPVFNDIGFNVLPGERVAVVGRTSVGKRTLTLAIIRGLEAELSPIKIDDIDISEVTLHQLRQAVTIVSQDPGLFRRSMSENLDPLRCYTNEEMLEVHRKVRLLHAISTDNLNSATTLNYLDHSADALSRGQGQLLCISQ